MDFAYSDKVQDLQRRVGAFMIFISPTSCREQIPDPEFFAQCIRDSFQEYLALASKPARAGRKAKRKSKRATKARKSIKVKPAAGTRRKAA